MLEDIRLVPSLQDLLLVGLGVSLFEWLVLWLALALALALALTLASTKAEWVGMVEMAVCRHSKDTLERFAPSEHLEVLPLDLDVRRKWLLRCLIEIASKEQELVAILDGMTFNLRTSLWLVLAVVLLHHLESSIDGMAKQNVLHGLVIEAVGVLGRHGDQDSQFLRDLLQGVQLVLVGVNRAVDTHFKVESLIAIHI